MKKFLSILSIILVLAIFLTACGKASVLPIDSEIYGCTYFPATSWGMNEEQLYKALGKTVDDFMREEIEGTVLTRRTELTGAVDFLSEECTTNFSFTYLPHSKTPMLSQVALTFPTNNKSFLDMIELLTELANEQNAEFELVRESGSPTTGNMNIVTLVSKNEIKDLPQEIKDGYNGYFRYLFDEGIVENIGLITKKKAEKTDFSKTFSTSLYSVKLYYAEDEELCQIIFDGGGITRALAFSEAYSELNG